MHASSFAVFCFLLLAPAFAGTARAQFTQPPPRTPPPSCERQKEDDGYKSDCKALLATSVDTSLYCEQQPGQWLSCITVTIAYGSDGWSVLDPATLTHYWRYVVDGQTYYLWPTHGDVIAVGCGRTRRGQVGVEVYGGSAVTDFACSGDPPSPAW